MSKTVQVQAHSRSRPGGKMGLPKKKKADTKAAGTIGKSAKKGAKKLKSQINLF